MKIFNRYLLSLLLSVSAYAGDIDERRHIEVSGTATVLVVPDTVVWRVEMQGMAGSLDEASAELEQAVIDLKSGLAEAEFAKDVMKLSAMSSGRSYEGHGAKRVFKGFYAKKSAVVELTELAKREALEKVLLKDDRVRIVSTASISSKETELKREVLLLAVKDGKQKADEMAQSLGATIGVVLSISEQGGNHGYAQENFKAMRSSVQGDSSLPSEDIEFRASVLVKFDLQ